MNSFYSHKELNNLGLRSFGDNVLISRFAQFYTPETVSIGSNVRIDDFCILSGDITLKSNIHISAYCALFGKMGIEIDDYSGLSPRCTMFSASDDFSGDFLISPMAPSKYTNVQGGKIILQRYVQIGAGSIVMPDLTIEEGVAVGAMSFVRKTIPAWQIYAGNPIKFVKTRNKGLLSKIG